MTQDNETIEPRYGEFDTSTEGARKKLHEENRLSWNEATKAHNSHKLDQAKFFREGGNKLFPEETALLGDLSGMSVLHLQCNAGQDTVSIKRLGSARVTGVDISDEAIAFARALATDAGVEATFHRSDLYEWLAEAAPGEERWDVVFSSYGAICWLSDLTTWAKGIAAVLKPGGRFILVEFHTQGGMFDPEMRHVYPYSTHGKPMTWDDGVSDYVAESGPEITPSGWQDGVQEFRNPHRVHEFVWSASEVITALLEAGLVLEHFEEYDYTGGFKMFKDMEPMEGRRWSVPAGVPTMALMYSVVARKPV